jgi:hypothetical protein
MGIIARDAALGPLSGAPGARFDATRLSWIGSPAKETNVCIAYHTAAVKSARDLFEKPLILGDTGPGTGTRSYPRVLNELLGMKFKLVGGFPSSADVFLAMERGEVEGICESLDSVKNRRPEWIPRKTVAVLLGHSRIRSSRTCRSCSTSPGPMSRGRRSNISTPGRGSGVRSWRRPTCRRSGCACCVRRSTPP